MADRLDNWYPCQIRMGQFTFPTAENAFQATRFTDPDMQYKFQYMPASEAAYRGPRFRTTRRNWQADRYDIMYGILKLKFSDPELASTLVSTDGDILIGNTRHENDWGSCQCARCAGRGSNNLGKLLMQLRKELRARNYHTEENAAGT